MDALKFTYEHQLSKQALIVDVLVVKKEHDIEIEKNIGRIFKAINLFEFKSEKDSLAVDDYNKVMGYAYIYAASTHTHVSDITISFAVMIHPRNLLHYLEHDRKFKVAQFEDGIYRVDGDTFPVQILESKKLSTEKNLFLKNLRSNLDKADAQRTVDAYKTIKKFDSKNAYIHRLAKANSVVFKELIKVSDAAIRDVIIMALAEESGLLDELVDKHYRERFREKAMKIAEGFKQDNVPFSVIAKNTGLTLQEVEAL